METRKPRVVSRGDDHHAVHAVDPLTADDPLDDFNYFAFMPSERMEMLKKKIEEREKTYFELLTVAISLEGNPEGGEHVERSADGPPCMCGACELGRVRRMMESMRYAIQRLRALYARLQ